MTLATALAAAAQQNTPHAGYVYPAGGRQGASFEVTVGGQSLSGVNGALMTGDGVRVSVLEYIKPLPPGQAGMLRDRLKELNEKRRAANIANTPPAADKSAAISSSVAASTPVTPPAAWTEGDEKELRELRLKLAQFQRRSTSVAIAERVRLQVSIDGAATAGKRELRLETPNGVTNPIYFYVGRLPEWSKAAAGTVTEEEVNEQGYLRKRLENPASTPVVEVTPPLIVNGQMAAGGVDRYRFMASKGEHLVVAAGARELVPYIADAVPGWFQASLTLYDASGKEVQYADHYGFHPDPVLLYEVPSFSARFLL
jgi:hypothetical protein